MRIIDWFMLVKIVAIVACIFWFGYLESGEKGPAIIGLGVFPAVISFGIFCLLLISLFSRLFGFVVHRPYRPFNWMASGVVVGTLGWIYSYFY